MTFRRIEHGVVDSTSERAFAALLEGTARDGDVHVADAQTAGRGRLGRTWFSAPGEGLYLSVVLLPPPPGWSAAALTMAAGLATLDAARAALGGDDADTDRALRLKWPNDVVDARGAKLAGVLVETRGLDPSRPHYVVGIGVNVLQRAFPPELEAERPATSLARLGVDVAVSVVGSLVLDALSARLAGITADPAALSEDFLAATGLAHSAVAVGIGGEERYGDLVALSLDEGVVLRTPESVEERIALEHVRSLVPA